MDLSSLVFEDSSPWPSIEIAGKNQRYAAAILSNIGACNSEMSAISLYVYNSIITKNFFFDIAECFHRISIVEMHHLNIFGELSIMLGTDPRLWSYQNGRMRYWSPACNRYPTRIGALVTNALNGELETIKKYQAQAEWIDDCSIKAILNRIIADELCHVEIFRSILAELNQDSFIQSAELKSNDETLNDANQAGQPEAVNAIDDTKATDNANTIDNLENADTADHVQAAEATVTADILRDEETTVTADTLKDAKNTVTANTFKAAENNGTVRPGGAGFNSSQST